MNMRLTDAYACGLIDVPLASLTSGDLARIGWMDRSSIDKGDESTPRLTMVADADDDDDEFSTQTMWPLLHGWAQRPRFRRTWWRKYRFLNECAARAVSRSAPRNALVWVYSHRRLLVPAMVKHVRPDLKVALFVQTPFPSYELLAPLPWRREVVRGMSKANVLGFQTNRDAANALGAIDRFGIDSPSATVPDHHAPQIVTLPTSIDFAEWDALGRSACVNAFSRQDRPNEFTFLGVDTLDDGNYADRALQAFGELLDEGRMDPRSSRFVQLVVPAGFNASIARKDLRQREQLVQRINQRHSSTTGELCAVQILGPVDHGMRASWYHGADSLVLMPLVEGMNLVAKEFVASRIDLNATVLLSEFSGAASGLPGAVLVNAYDLDAIKRAMLQARAMRPHERRRRMQTMRSAVRNHDVVAWSTLFVDLLASAR